MFAHPARVCMTYLEHWMFAMRLAAHFFKAAVASVVHAFIPDLCVHSSSETIVAVSSLLNKAGCR